MRINQTLLTIIYLIVATTLEVSGDALIRKCIYNHIGIYRIVLGAVGCILLLGYGLALNLAPVEFGKVVGLYIATLFVVWQIITYFSFGTVPSLSVIVGGLLIFTGGLIVSFGKF